MGDPQQRLEIDTPLQEHVATAKDWKKALDKVVPAVVFLRITACRAFDTEFPGIAYGTGFVVDKRRGIILTCRHTVMPGPVVAEAMFSNREEVPALPLYRDPVHDFGFFRYDPGAIQFQDYEEIPLAPEAACVGLEIRIVGNDGGEKVSILAGTLSRLDRDAPGYKKDGYNDFNIFYLQAASGTKGGSGGSPVIDWQGRAVALNVGSNLSSASAFFVPLERVVRALTFLQKGNDTYVDKWKAVSIPRGTLQVTFLHKGFDEARHLGLQSETEKIVRHASPAGETGMLVVDSVVPRGPGYKQLEPGDVLVRINGEVITQFLKLETLLDDSINKNIELQIERGGSSMTVNLWVQDLDSITPDHFLEVSGAVIHSLSYQQARNFCFQRGLVYVADPGYMLSRAGVPRHAIITKFADEEIYSLGKLISVVSKLSRGARVRLDYISYEERHQNKSVLVMVDRHEWYAPPQIYTRDDSTGLWIVKPVFRSNYQFLLSPIKHAGYLATRVGCTMHDILMCYKDATAANLSVAEGVIKPSLVMIEAHVPPSCLLDGVHPQHVYGTGVIIYHSKDVGLVAVDKNTVPISASDVTLSFAAFPLELLGEVVFLHPVHNFALISYDPSALGFGAWYVRAAELLPEPALRRGDSVYLVGLSGRLQARSRKSVVTNPCAALNIVSADRPRYQATNMEVIELDIDFGSTFSGVLTDEHGRVQAIWGKFSFQLKPDNNTRQDHQFTRGIPIYAISEILEKIESGANGPSLLINGVKRHMPLVRILEVELYPTLLLAARSRGLGDDFIKALVKKDPTRRQVLCVKGVFAGSRAENVLKNGDMVLAIDKELVTCFRDIENACQALDKSDANDGKLQMTILRQRLVFYLPVGTDVRDGIGTTRAINWCGCIVQDPHPAVRARGFLPKEGHGVYVASCYHGSPVQTYGLFAFQWIVEINQKPTPDLDAFVKVTQELKHGEFVRVKIVDLNGKPQVLTLKQDLHYWPTWELRFDPDTAFWHRNVIKALDCGSI